MEDELTPKQRAVFGWIKEFTRLHGMPPTVREIGNKFHNKSSSIFQFLTALERKGYIRRGNLGARSIQILKERDDKNNVDTMAIPIVGRVAAGQPVLAVENIEGYLPVASDWLRGKKAFALKVRGESMIEAGILDGDMLIVWQTQSAENGDVVVALIEDEATVKRFRKRKNRIELIPENSGMEPIICDGRNLLIVGKVIGVQRRM